MADPRRARAIISTRDKWVNGTVLHYCFFGAGNHFSVPKVQADAVRDAFAKWKAVGIDLEFVEVNQLSEAEVRIGYSTADGSSASAVGRDVLNVPLNEPTTVYGWDLTTRYGRGTALHELGHVLGMEHEHEHQNPYAGIKWHEQAVYDALAKPPNNWDHDTYHNILAKLTPQQVQGSTWDPDSIMEYEFEPGLIDEPEQYDINGLTPPGTLSAADKQWALQWYPTLRPGLTTLQPFQMVSAEIAAGQQLDYAIKPTATRRYTIETKGASDTLLVLFEDVVSRQLNNLKAEGGELYAFGSHFHDPAPKPGIDTEFGTKDGIHDIHMNQGNAPHEHDEDNGVFNDGVILKFPDHVTGLFFRFKTQFLPTDANGDRIPGVSNEIPPGATPVETTPLPIPDDPQPTFPAVYVERSLMNPGGDDVTKEVVVIGNTTIETVDLSGWRIVDKNNAAEILGTVMLPPGGSVPVVLSGIGAQLSNKGGTIRLLNRAGVLVHAVSYSKADAVENRYVRFNT